MNEKIRYLDRREPMIPIEATCIFKNFQRAVEHSESSEFGWFLWPSDNEEHVFLDIIRAVVPIGCESHSANRRHLFSGFIGIIGVEKAPNEGIWQKNETRNQ